MAESMQGLKRTHRCLEVINAKENEEVTLMAWVQKARNKGQLIFVDLRDRTGILQVVFEKDTVSEEVFEKATKLKAEYCVAVVGRVEKRKGAFNENLKTGELEVIASDLRILSEALTPPFPIEENSKTKEELRLKYRFLDLRRLDIQRNIILRSNIATTTRAFLAENEFLEIETPTLIKSSPEGARDYLVPSRVHKGKFYALPQSPQLFKQLLMCAGYDRYFQLARCYRDEDLRADRQPEFTQIDMELSFSDVEDVISVNEKLMQRIFKDVLDIELKLPFPRITYKEAMERYGSDKPDLRFSMELKDVSDIVKDCEFSVFKEATKNGSVRAINVKGFANAPRKKIDSYVNFVKDYGAKGLSYIALEEGGNIKSPFAKFMKEEELNQIYARLDAKENDLLLFVADTNKVVFASLGALRCHIAKELNLIDKTKFEFAWVVEFPLFEYSEEDNRYYAVHHPFTSPMDEDMQYLDSDLLKVRAKAYDIVLNGVEIGGGSVRIHQNDIQEKMFDILGISKEVANLRFGYLLEAFKYGVPPHAGLAYGLDRLAMLMVGAETIKDVIAFPKVKDASDLMINAPDFVDAEQLEELYIKIEEE